jgi:iron(III) transport system permease protein
MVEHIDTRSHGDVTERQAAKRRRFLTPTREVVLGALFVALLATLLLGLVAYVVTASFDTAPFDEPYHFGLAGWRQILANNRTWHSITTSFILAIRVPIAIAIAFIIAWLLTRVRIPGARAIEVLLWFGFVLPSVPMILGWILLLDTHYGLLNQAAKRLPLVGGPLFSIYSIPGILWVHLSLTTVPIMVILLAPAFRQIDAAIEEAADISGGGTVTTLRRIIIPLLLPTVLAAFVAGFIRSLDSFEVEQILGAPANIYVYSTRIYDLINADPPNYPQAMALSTLFLVLLVGLAVFYQLYLNRIGSRATIGGKGVRTPERTRTWRAYAASMLIFLVIGIILFLPLVVLVLGSFTRLYGFFFLPNAWTIAHWVEVFGDQRFARSALTTLLLGLTVGGLGVIAFALIAWVLVRTRIWGRGLLTFLVWLPWGIPGLVLGVTLLSLMLNLPLLNRLYGTIVPLILALIIKELPIGVQLMRNALAQISVELEEAAIMAGGTFTVVFRRITLPLVMPMMLSVFLLVFAGAARDIGTIVLLAAPGTRTLSLLMFDFAASQHLEAAAVVGVLIAALCLITTALAFGIGSRTSFGDR